MAKEYTDKEAAEGISKRLQFVIDELAEIKYSTYLTVRHRHEAEFLLMGLGKPISEDLEGKLIAASELFVSANSLQAYYKSKADLADKEVETTIAKASIRIRNELDVRGEKYTEGKITAATTADSVVTGAKEDAVMCRQLADIFYGLREAIRMRFSALEQVSNNRRAEMKVEG